MWTHTPDHDYASSDDSFTVLKLVFSADQVFNYFHLAPSFYYYHHQELRDPL
jgi:hypothetical protein